MRKPRAVIVDDEPFIRNMLKDFFLLRGYEVLSYGDGAMACPVYGTDDGRCMNDRPCSDVLLTDFMMPQMNGVQFLKHQKRKGCKLDHRNKAVISGYVDDANRQALDSMGSMFFRKPFTIFALSEWLAECEQRVDLTKPLATRRKEDRFESYRELSVRIGQTNCVVSGIAVNISKSGFCLEVAAPLRRSDVIHFLDCPFTTYRAASVRWVRSCGSDACLVGVQCLTKERVAGRSLLAL